MRILVHIFFQTLTLRSIDISSHGISKTTKEYCTIYECSCLYANVLLEGRKNVNKDISFINILLDMNSACATNKFNSNPNHDNNTIWICINSSVLSLFGFPF